MALYFTKRRRWPPSKPVQFILAIICLLLAIAILVSWLMIRYQKGSSTTTENPDTTATTAPLSVGEIGRSLLILDFEGAERFVLIQANPNQAHIAVVPIPANIADEDGILLSEGFRRRGAFYATQLVSQALQLPVEHYITLNGDGVERLLNQLDNGVLFKVPEKIAYTDENGATIRLSAEEHRLTPSQARSLLSYTKWQKTKNRNNLAANLTMAVLNQYLLENRSLEGYFANLSNAATTDLRIDNFNAYRPSLVMLAEKNDGTLCHRVDVSGKEKKGVYHLNLEEIRQNTNLYE